MTEVVEVSNVYTIYGVSEDGSEADQPIASFSRPQDWGDPRWHYELFRFDWIREDKHYINHAHCWTDMQRKQHEYPQLFAPLFCMILMPGKPHQLCGKDFLDTDDFWFDSWGKMPPYYESDDEDYFEY